MDKRSILEAAQREGTLGVDEGSKRMKDQVYFFGNMIFTVTYIILACFSLITSTELNTGVTAMFLASITGGLFARWRLSGIKAHLFLFLIGAATTALALVITILDMYGAQ